MRLVLVLLFCGAFCGAGGRMGLETANGNGSPGRPDLEGAKRAISANNRLYFLAFSRGDPAMFAELFAKDCWIMPAAGSTLCGEEAPVDFFRETYHDLGVRGGRFISVDIYGDGREFVTEAGFYRFVDGAGNVVGDGTFLVLWRKTAGGWMRFRDCFGRLDP